MPLRWDPWNEVAVALDGTLRIKTGLASSEIALTVRLTGAEVVARGKSVPYGGRDYTRVSADAPGTGHLHVVVNHHGERGPRRTHRVQVDDPALSKRGTVYSNDAGLARTWLDENVREQIVACPYTVELRGERIIASIGTLENDPDRLEQAIRTVAHIGRRGTGLRRAWMSLAEDAIVLGSTNSDEGLSKLPPLQMSHGGAKVTISPFYGAVGRRRHGRRFFTQLRAERRAHTMDEYVVHPTYAERALKPRLKGGLEPLEPPPLERWHIECRDEARMRARLVSPIPELLERSGVAVIVATRKHVTVSVPGLLVDAGQLRAALALSAKLAVEIETEAVGPYR